MNKNDYSKNKKSVLIGFLLGIYFLNFFFSNFETKKSLEDLALGDQNKKKIAFIEDRKIHCSALNDSDLCIDGYKNIQVNSPIVIWLGNSQLHAINQYALGDETAAIKLYRYLKKHDIYTLTFSQANANLQEHYLLFTYLLDQLSIKTLILPIIFDDTREDNIRSDIKEILNNKAIYKKINQTLTGKSLIKRFNNKDFEDNFSKNSKNIESNNFENFLDEKFGKIWPLWNKREILRGNLINSLYLIRNNVFGINASTIRKKIPGRYNKNINAYKDILLLAKKNNVEVLVYIPPIRNDVTIPYDLNEYNSFKKEVSIIANDSDVHFTNLENLIPPNYWGVKPSTNYSGKIKKSYELDFMHFQSKGHELLAEAIYFEITKFLQKIIY